MAKRLSVNDAAGQFNFASKNAEKRFKKAYKSAVAGGGSAKAAKRAAVKAGNTGSGGG